MRKAEAHSNASPDEIKKYELGMSNRGIEILSGNSISEDQKKEQKKKQEEENYFKMRRLENLYKDHEIDNAKRQRDLLGLSIREFIILHGIEKSIGKIELSEEEMQEEWQKIMTSYRKNASPAVRVKEAFIGDPKTFLKFMGDVPLHDDRGETINKYKENEKDMVYGSTSISKKREELGMNEEQFLTAFGVLPKE